MELILLEKITHLGNLGQKVKVRSGYGRNYLIPQGKALPATAENQAVFEARRAELEKNQAEHLDQARSRSEKLAGMSIVIPRRVGGEGRLFGSVSASDIAEAVTAAGVEITRQEVRLPEGPLRQIGEYAISLHLHTDIDSSVTVHVVAEE
jgi:large subunit ribosomal protein L9